MDSLIRKTTQFLMPAVKPEAEAGKYDIYPVFNIGKSKILRGLHVLAEIISAEKTVFLDGFQGIDFHLLKEELQSILSAKYDLAISWVNMDDFLREEAEIDRLISPFLGGDDPVFGKRTTLGINDFFSEERIRKYKPDKNSSINIIYGTGASILGDEGFLIFIDMPKNELQFRSRAGKVHNLGARSALDHKIMYKRFYFVDWVVLGKYKQRILERIDVFADGQRESDLTWISGDEFRQSLNEMTNSAIRARPWFEPGTWGGSWIIDNIPGINKEVLNYAWSFELITPENGLIIESSGLMLEFSFDFLIFREAERILGDCYTRFGTEFPVRFDFLDTFDGGNLSVQCHPRPEYMKENFGENFTQEETYYILDTRDNADVYLGFQEDIQKDDFIAELEDSFLYGKPVEIEKYVQKHPSHKHDLFLIPYGTVHGSGKNNLVLEISSTPYIFTFKMYDWLRPDLDGKPRPLNIMRAAENLYFERKGKTVKDELISFPVLIGEGEDWKLFHLPTHRTHLYDIVRYHFNSHINVVSNNKVQILSLVEGRRICIEIEGQKEKVFHFAETFILPASVKGCRVINLSEKPAILVIAFIK